MNRTPAYTEPPVIVPNHHEVFFSGLDELPKEDDIDYHAFFDYDRGNSLASGIDIDSPLASSAGESFSSTPNNNARISSPVTMSQWELGQRNSLTDSFADLMGSANLGGGGSPLSAVQYTPPLPPTTTTQDISNAARFSMMGGGPGSVVNNKNEFSSVCGDFRSFYNNSETSPILNSSTTTTTAHPLLGSYSGCLNSMMLENNNNNSSFNESSYMNWVSASTSERSLQGVDELNFLSKSATSSGIARQLDRSSMDSIDLQMFQFEMMAANSQSPHHHQNIFSGGCQNGMLNNNTNSNSGIMVGGSVTDFDSLFGLNFGIMSSTNSLLVNSSSFVDSFTDLSYNNNNNVDLLSRIGQIDPKTSSSFSQFNEFQHQQLLQHQQKQKQQQLMNKQQAKAEQKKISKKQQRQLKLSKKEKAPKINTKKKTATDATHTLTNGLPSPISPNKPDQEASSSPVQQQLHFPLQNNGQNMYTSIQEYQTVYPLGTNLQSPGVSKRYILKNARMQAMPYGAVNSRKGLALLDLKRENLELKKQVASAKAVREQEEIESNKMMETLDLLINSRKIC